MINFFNKKPKLSFAYGDFVKFKEGFYNGYIGRIVATANGKYLIKLQGKDPIYTSLDFTASDIWAHPKEFEKLDAQVEKVKEDFWNSIKPKESDNKAYSLESIFGPTQKTQIAPVKKKALMANAITKLTNKKVTYNPATDSFDVIEIESDVIDSV